MLNDLRKAKLNTADGDVTSFSESKKQFKKTKLLVTYDIFENKKYALLLTLIESMINDKNALKNLRSYVLPVKTPPERYLEVYQKVIEKQRKKHKKSKQAHGAPGSTPAKTSDPIKIKPKPIGIQQELLLENLDEHVEMVQTIAPVHSKSKKNGVVPVSGQLLSPKAEDNDRFKSTGFKKDMMEDEFDYDKNADRTTNLPNRDNQTEAVYMEERRKNPIQILREENIKQQLLHFSDSQIKDSPEVGSIAANLLSGKKQLQKNTQLPSLKPIPFKLPDQKDLLNASARKPNMVSPQSAAANVINNALMPAIGATVVDKNEEEEANELREFLKNY